MPAYEPEGVGGYLYQARTCSPAAMLASMNNFKVLSCRSVVQMSANGLGFPGRRLPDNSIRSTLTSAGTHSGSYLQ
eukprot:1194929-Prorocentrum_minimum.AAC.4